jgi:hypothetical protein
VDATLLDLVEELRERNVLRGAALTGILKQREQGQQQQDDDHPEGEIAQVGVHPTSFVTSRMTSAVSSLAAQAASPVYLAPSSRKQDRIRRPDTLQHHAHDNPQFAQNSPHTAGQAVGMAKPMSARPTTRQTQM